MKPKSWRIGLTGAAVLALTLAACSSGTADGNSNGNGPANGDDTAERIYVEALNVTPEGMTVHFAPTPIGAMFSSQPWSHPEFRGAEDERVIDPGAEHRAAGGGREVDGHALGRGAGGCDVEPLGGVIGAGGG